MKKTLLQIKYELLRLRKRQDLSKKDELVQKRISKLKAEYKHRIQQE